MKSEIYAGPVLCLRNGVLCASVAGNFIELTSSVDHGGWRGRTPENM